MSNGHPWPRVSIVTPSLNQAPFLEATIRSVVHQGYSSLEYFVFDGGSTDGSAEIIARYADRLAGWVSRPDRGQADAINQGWQRSSGDILAYLNSDDLYQPEAIRRAATYLDEHPEVGIVYGACQVIDERGAALGGPRDMSDASLRRLLRSPLPQPTMFFRRWVFDRIGWLDPGLHCTMDWDLTLRAALSGIPIARLAGQPLAAVRVWRGAKTSSLFEQCLEESLRLRDRLLARPDLSREAARAIERSKGTTFLWPAYEYYVRGEMAAARNLLHRAVRMRWLMALHPEFFGLYGRTWLGRSTSQAARRLRARLRVGGGAGGWRSEPNPR